MPDDAPSESRSSHSWTWWALWLFILVFIIYPLSIGPVALLASKQVLPLNTVKIYSPLATLDNHSSSAHDFFVWYLRLWGILYE